MQVYGSILPGAATLARLLPEQAAEARHKASEARQEVKLSWPAQHRLKVVRWHLDHGENVSLTARHFGRSRDVGPGLAQGLQGSRSTWPRGQEPPAAQATPAHLVKRARAASAGAT